MNYFLHSISKADNNDIFFFLIKIEIHVKIERYRAMYFHGYSNLPVKLVHHALPRGRARLSCPGIVEPVFRFSSHRTGHVEKNA